MKKDYDWIDDPFKESDPLDEKKNMSSSSKLAIGCGFLLVIAGLVVLSVLSCSVLIDVS